MNIETAVKSGRTSLSEYESKHVLSSYGIPVTKEVLINESSEIAAAADVVGYPLVMKGCAHTVLHKTESDLVRIDIRSKAEAAAAFNEIRSNMIGEETNVLVQEMVRGKRELVAGMMRDPQFGPCVMFGIGGIFTEILEDVCFRVAPLTRNDALAMIQGIRGKKILDAVRGMPAVNQDALADILMAIGRIGSDHEQVQEIDINPVKVPNGLPVAVDALIVLNRDQS